MRRGSDRGVRALGLMWAVLAVTACGIAETKLPPEPTVEYLPCYAIDLSGSMPAEPFPVLVALIPDLESLWGGSWQVGAESHIGLTDVGAVDWQTACPEIGDTDLVVHEVPFPLADVMAWADLVEGRIADGAVAGAASHEVVVSAGQHVVEIRAETVEDAALLAAEVPLGAWTYGGTSSSGTG